MKTYNTQEKFLKDCIDNTFEIEDDIELNFNLYYPELNIKCKNLKALNINVNNINAIDLTTRDLNANDISSIDIKAYDIIANNISAYDIKAFYIKVNNINAFDIKVNNITADDISYFAVCFAYKNITCKSIKGVIDKAKHFCIYGDLTINGVVQNENL